jgi:KaiC/GvpD/RAD55 family RecA-like ATPase
MHARDRLSTGILELDGHLGGGLLPGALTVLAGATGIGKTQLGLDFLNAGQQQEGRRGVVFDMSSRGDSQNHASYAAKHFGWQLRPMTVDVGTAPISSTSPSPRPSPVKGEGVGERAFESPAPSPLSPAGLWAADGELGDYVNLFQHTGQRVTQRDLGFDDWLNWKAEMAKQLAAAIYFFYGHFIRGVRRAVIDGMEPVERPSESIQFELFEYIYHQILRKESDWVARDLLREHFRANEAEVVRHAYDYRQIGCMLLYTTRENMLEDLIGRPLDEGDVLSNANTVIFLGRVRDGNRLGRALYIAKHRGSACSEEIVPYHIDDGGIELGLP